MDNYLGLGHVLVEAKVLTKLLESLVDVTASEVARLFVLSKIFFRAHKITFFILAVDVEAQGFDGLFPRLPDGDSQIFRL